MPKCLGLCVVCERISRSLCSLWADLEYLCVLGQILRSLCTQADFEVIGHGFMPKSVKGSVYGDLTVCINVNCGYIQSLLCCDDVVTVCFLMQQVYPSPTHRRYACMYLHMQT